MRLTILGAVVGVVGAILGCGGSSSYGGSSPPPPATCSGATSVALTVKNYLSWCSVSVAGQPTSTASSQTVCVAPGPVALSATAQAGYELGSAPWHGTTGDQGSGDPGTLTGESSAATVTAAGSTTCAWVCCPFTNGSGCPTSNLCP